MTSTNSEATISDREIVISRLLDAPRELVYEMFTKPEHVAQWWGPRGFTNTIHSMDVRPGGEWRFIMHGPDGTDYKNLIVFSEVTPPERLAYDHSDGEGGQAFQASATFDDQGGKTLVTLRMVFDSAETVRIMVEEVGAVEGGKQTLERLSEYVAAL